MSSSYPQKRKHSASAFETYTSLSESLTSLYECSAPKVIKYCFGKPDKIRAKYTPYEQLFDQKNVFFVDERYLTSYDKYDGDCSGSVCIVIKSQMGTGKSSRFFDYVRDNRSILIIGSRKTYCDFMCSQRGDLINYQDVDGMIDFIKHPKIVIQVQSLRRIKEIAQGTVFAQWDSVYLDEFDSICKELISDLCSSAEKAENVSYFSKLVATVNHVIVCDANIGKWHYAVLEKLMRGITKDTMSLVINVNKGLFGDAGCRQIYAYDNCFFISLFL